MRNNPLRGGSTRSTVSHNIRELRHKGYPQKQAVAISLENARRHPSRPRKENPAHDDQLEAMARDEARTTGCSLVEARSRLRREMQQRRAAARPKESVSRSRRENPIESYKCALCGQQVDDGLPCGCGARGARASYARPGKCAVCGYPTVAGDAVCHKHGGNKAVDDTMGVISVRIGDDVWPIDTPMKRQAAEEEMASLGLESLPIQRNGVLTGTRLFASGASMERKQNPIAKYLVSVYDKSGRTLLDESESVDNDGDEMTFLLGIAKSRKPGEIVEIDDGMGRRLRVRVTASGYESINEGSTSADLTKMLGRGRHQNPIEEDNFDHYLPNPVKAPRTGKVPSGFEAPKRLSLPSERETTMKPVYAILTPDGLVSSTHEGTLADVQHEAMRKYPKGTRFVLDADPTQVAIEDETEAPRLPNPASRMAHLALKQAGLSPITWAEMVNAGFTDDDEGLARAHKALLKYMPDTKAYATPAKMKKAFIVANAKTTKAVEGTVATGGMIVPPSISRGLALLPYDLARILSPVKLPIAEAVGLCVGSSKACRSTCLVYSGQNQAVKWNDIVKMKRTQALVLEPLAFLRMFVESIRAHVKASKKAGMVPYVRPNIYSDIPWEIFCPDLFKNLPDVSFYDYTKVAGRDTSETPNYDLTFSYSGENISLCEQELDRGRRVAVVFLRRTKSGERPADPVDDIVFLGRPVVDGDLHDLRPLDKKGVVVGLRYKRPNIGERPPETRDASGKKIEDPAHKKARIERVRQKRTEALEAASDFVVLSKNAELQRAKAMIVVQAFRIPQPSGKDALAVAAVPRQEDSLIENLPSAAE